MKENDSFLKTFPITFTIMIIVGVLLGILVDLKTGVSFALGCVTTLMMMSMLFKSTTKVVEMTDKVQAQRQTVKNYAFRFFFYVLILVIAAVHPNLDILFVAIGFFVFKIVLYIVLFLEKKGGDSHV